VVDFGYWIVGFSISDFPTWFGTHYLTWVESADIMRGDKEKGDKEKGDKEKGDTMRGRCT